MTFAARIWTPHWLGFQLGYINIINITHIKLFFYKYLNACCALDIGARDMMMTKTGMAFALKELISGRGDLEDLDKGISIYGAHSYAQYQPSSFVCLISFNLHIRRSTSGRKLCNHSHFLDKGPETHRSSGSCTKVFREPGKTISLCLTLYSSC